MRRENGTPGDGCAVRVKRRRGAEVSRKPRSRCVSIASGCPAGCSWSRQGTLSIGTSLLQRSVQPGATPSSRASSTACTTMAGWCGPAVTPSQLHAFAISTNRASIHNPRTVDVRSLRWRCRKLGMISYWLHLFPSGPADQKTDLTPSRHHPYCASVTCPFAA